MICDSAYASWKKCFTLPVHFVDIHHDVVWDEMNTWSEIIFLFALFRLRDRLRLAGDGRGTFWSLPATGLSNIVGTKRLRLHFKYFSEFPVCGSFAVRVYNGMNNNHIFSVVTHKITTLTVVQLNDRFSFVNNIPYLCVPYQLLWGSGRSM